MRPGRKRIRVSRRDVAVSGQDADWYCSFVVPVQVQPLPETGRVLGVDWGVRETATTTSDAHDLPHAGHGRKAKAKLARYDRMMARRKPKKGKPGSKGYREARKLRAKAHKKVA